MKEWTNVGLVLLMCALGSVTAQATEEVAVYCQESYEENQVCPHPRCILECRGTETPCASLECRPRWCSSFSEDECPADICHVATNCSGNRICEELPNDPPSCGETGYAGQDVACCYGFVRRCGIEFYDRTCDMLGENSVYHLPICIPCGDGVCTNFENRCNCPEDCGEGEAAYQGERFEGEAVLPVDTADEGTEPDAGAAAGE